MQDNLAYIRSAYARQLGLHNESLCKIIWLAQKAAGRSLALLGLLGALGRSWGLLGARDKNPCQKDPRTDNPPELRIPKPGGPLCRK